MTRLHRRDHTIAELQRDLPWNLSYGKEFDESVVPHKHFAHALTHIAKASGYLNAVLDDMDHGNELNLDISKYLADVIISTIRAANTLPSGPIDLQKAVKERLESKNGIQLQDPCDEAANHLEDLFEELTGESPVQELSVGDILQTIRSNISI